jgi:2-octaprenyl-6-methoxyphenol hydroxylase
MVQSLLGGSLGAIDLFAPAKKMLAEQMMYGWR